MLPAPRMKHLSTPIVAEPTWKASVSKFLRVATDPALAHLSRHNLRFISAKTLPSSARGQRIVEQVRNEFAPALEPFMVHYEAEPLLLGFWMAASEVFFSPYLSRLEKEKIAVNVSRGNDCDYCARAHDQIARASEGCAPATASPATAEGAAEAIAIARVFHYINRMMLVFTHRPNPFLRLNFFHPIMGTIANLRVGPEARRRHEQGLSLQLLEDGDPMPRKEDEPLFAWADTIPVVQLAFRQWHAFMLETERSLEISAAAKAHLRKQVFPETATPALTDADRNLIRFAEGLIFSPGRMTAETLEALQTQFASDAARVNFVGWCSYLATFAFKLV